MRFAGLRPNLQTRTDCKRIDPCRLKRSEKDYVVPTQTWYIEQVEQEGPIGNDGWGSRRGVMRDDRVEVSFSRLIA